MTATENLYTRIADLDGQRAVLEQQLTEARRDLEISYSQSLDPGRVEQARSVLTEVPGKISLLETEAEAARKAIPTAERQDAEQNLPSLARSAKEGIEARNKGLGEVAKAIDALSEAASRLDAANKHPGLVARNDLHRLGNEHGFDQPKLPDLAASKGAIMKRLLEVKHLATAAVGRS